MHTVRRPWLALWISWIIVFTSLPVQSRSTSSGSRPPTVAKTAPVSQLFEQLKIAEYAATGKTASLVKERRAFMDAFFTALSPRLQVLIHQELVAAFAPTPGATQVLQNQMPGGAGLPKPTINPKLLPTVSLGQDSPPVSLDELVDQLANPTPADAAFVALWPKLRAMEKDLADLERFIDTTRTTIYEAYRQSTLTPGTGSELHRIKEFVQLNIHGTVRRILRSDGLTELPDLAGEPRCANGLIGSFAFLNALLAEATDGEAILPVMQQHQCQSVSQSLFHEFAYVHAVEWEEARLVRYQLPQIYPVVAAMNFPVMLALWDGKQWMGATPFFRFFQWNRNILGQKKYQDYGVWVAHGGAELMWAIDFCQPAKAVPQMSLLAAATPLPKGAGAAPAKVIPAVGKTAARVAPQWIKRYTPPYLKSPPLFTPPIAINPDQQYTAYGVAWSGDSQDLCSAEHLFKIPAHDGGTCIAPDIFLDRLTNPLAWAFGNCNLEQFIEQGLRCHQPIPWCETPTTLGLADTPNKPAPFAMIMPSKEVATCSKVDVGFGPGSSEKGGGRMQCGGQPLGAGAGGLISGAASTEGVGGKSASGSSEVSDIGSFGSSSCGGRSGGGNGPMDDDGSGDDSGGDDSGDGDNGGDDSGGDDDSGDGDDGNDDGDSSGGQSGGNDSTPDGKCHRCDFEPQVITAGAKQPAGGAPSQPHQPPEGPAARPKSGPESTPSGPPAGNSSGGSSPSTPATPPSDGGPKDPSPGAGQSGGTGGTMQGPGGSSGPDAPLLKQPGKGPKKPKQPKKPQGKGSVVTPEPGPTPVTELTTADLTPEAEQKILDKYYGGKEENFRRAFEEFTQLVAEKTLHNKDFRRRVADITIKILQRHNIPMDEGDEEELRRNIDEAFKVLNRLDAFRRDTELSERADPKHWEPGTKGPTALGLTGFFGSGVRKQNGSAIVKIERAHAMLGLADPTAQLDLADTIVHEWLHKLFRYLQARGFLTPAVRSAPTDQVTIADLVTNEKKPVEHLDTVEHLTIYVITRYLAFFFDTPDDGMMSIQSSQTPDSSGSPPPGPSQANTPQPGEVVAPQFYGYGPTHFNQSTKKEEERYPGSARMCEDPMGCRDFDGCTPPQAQATLNCAVNIQQAKWATGLNSADSVNPGKVGDPSPLDDPEIPDCSGDTGTSGTSKCRAVDCPPDNPNCCNKSTDGNPYAIDYSIFQDCWMTFCGESQESCPCAGLRVLKDTALDRFAPARLNTPRQTPAMNPQSVPRSQTPKGAHGQ